MDRFEKIFVYLLKAEGGYSNDKYDAGGKTKYGIIESEARKYGYKGHMRDMPLSIARDIYNKKYYRKNGLDTLKSDKIALSVCDFVVNAGTWGAKKAQAALNELGFDLRVDGILGEKSLAALNEVDENKFLENAYDRLKLSPRSYIRTLKVARTIADIEQERKVSIEHLAEALGYRCSEYDIGKD